MCRIRVNLDGRGSRAPSRRSPGEGERATAVTTPPPDAELAGFLALLATTRSPRTVEAYRRDLGAFSAWLEAPPGNASTRDLEIPRGAAGIRARACDDRPARRGDPGVLPPSRPPRCTSRQSRGGGRPPAPPASPPSHALAGGGGAPHRGSSRDDAPRIARPRLARAPVRRGAPRQRSDRARAGFRRPGAAPSPRRRQRGQGARRADRAARRGRASPLPRPRPAAPRPAASPGALPQRARRGAHARGSIPDRPTNRREGRAGPRARPSSSTPPLVRNAPARGRRRPAQRPGDARPRRPRDDRALYPRFRSSPPRGLLQRAPARASPPFQRLTGATTRNERGTGWSSNLSSRRLSWLQRASAC